MEVNTVNELNRRITTKISRNTLRLLRLIAATTGERLYVTLDRVLQAEWARVQGAIPPAPERVAPPTVEK